MVRTSGPRGPCRGRPTQTPVLPALLRFYSARWGRRGRRGRSRPGEEPPAGLPTPRLRDDRCSRSGFHGRRQHACGGAGCINTASWGVYSASVVNALRSGASEIFPLRRLASVACRRSGTRRLTPLPLRDSGGGGSSRPGLFWPWSSQSDPHKRARMPQTCAYGEGRFATHGRQATSLPQTPFPPLGHVRPLELAISPAGP